MKKPVLYFLLSILLFVGIEPVYPQSNSNAPAFQTDSILERMYRVNDYFLSQQWKRVDRNWIRGTYYTGVMALYHNTNDHNLFDQAATWAARHGWRTGTEWIYPANRMTCVQTYLELYFIDPDEHKINNAREVMEDKLKNNKPAAEQGWDYVDALYVGTPAYMMMTTATKDPSFANYGHRMFRDVHNDLYDNDEHLFYRDEKSKQETSKSGNRVFWSRGNGWAMASIPRILKSLPKDDPHRQFYIGLLQEMAASIAKYQGDDGFWRVNLTDSIDFPAPESSGTAFFTYALSWGISCGYLDKHTYNSIVEKAWQALYNNIGPTGKVLWGQGVARGPEYVSKEDSHEYVLGAFLLAGSEMLKMIKDRSPE